MSLFQRLFRKATGQPALPSDILVSLLYSKLLALPQSDLQYCDHYAGFCVQLGPDRWVNFHVYLGKGDSYVSSPKVMTSDKYMPREAEWCFARGSVRVTELPVTPTVRLMAESLGRMRKTAMALKEAGREADVQLAALDIVNEVLGLPTPEEQLALGQEYPRAEAVTVARPTPPQAKELRR